jgi:D-alanine-D-alanine ligase
MNKKLRVGLLFGGRSGEHEVSIASALSVYNALDKARYDVTLIGIDKAGRWIAPDPKILLAQPDSTLTVGQLRGSSFGIIPHPAAAVQLVPVEGQSQSIPHLDVVLPILHGTYGEDGTVQGLLELTQIPYVGSGVLGSALGMDKEVSRKLLKAAGIPTVPTMALRKTHYLQNRESNEAKILRDFALPFFVKPANAGSSVGVHKVKDAQGLRAALDDAFAFDVKVLIEKGVAARELECAVLGNDEPKASVVGEIIPHHEFYSYKAKYMDENGASISIPATEVPSATLEKIRQFALLAFTTLECRGMARVDFFLDRQTGELYLNEINTIPGFTKISMYPKLWEASGLSYGALLDELIRLALETFAQRSQLKTIYSE